MATLLREGFGHFEIIDVITKDREGSPLVSKTKGETMLKLKLLVTDKEGITETLYEYILPSLGWKLSQIRNALDIGSFYNESEWNIALLMYKSGTCTIKTQEGSNGYEAKSVIASYISSDVMRKLIAAPAKEVKDTKPTVKAAPATDSKVDWLDDDDSIPF